MNNKTITLCGEWSITTDPENNGRENGWQNAIPDTEIRQINIYDHMPNSYWTMELSYSNVFPKYHGYVWYYKSIPTVPTLEAGERMLLEFERAGYVCEAFVNGIRVGEHRDHEKKFAFDVTDAIRTDAENLLAVRCFEPRATGKPIDGIVLHEIPNSCWANIQAHMLGAEDTFCLECVGGILGAVHLRAVPEVAIDSIYIRALPETGDVYVTIATVNYTTVTKSKALSVVLSDKKSGTFICEILQSVETPSGKAEFTLCSNIENHQLWELDAPALYLATASIDGKDHHTVRFGFKDFRIKNGFFFLNGKRIFLKGAHCSINASYAITMKALGFNIIRTIARGFTDELLDICDEIGLLVMDAAATGWGMTLHSKTRQQVETYNANLIRQHRNHPSVAAYCLLNELENNDPLFHCFSESLPKLRHLAPDTLFLLHSGRWDRDISLGSASNPGSDRWDTYLGGEGIPDYPNRKPPFPCDGYQDTAMGDIHIYMHIPVSAESKLHFRTIGAYVRPIFVSESGIASQPDPMGVYLAHCNEPLSKAITTEQQRRLWDETEEFLDFYDLRNVYPLSFDFSRATEKLNGTQRTLLYNIYRSNPMINGFSFTSFGVSHEGTLQGNLVIKDSLAYAIQQGNEPLRWSLFTSERTVYANIPFSIEAVLCNEDVLAPGAYAAQAYITGKNGCVWKQLFNVDYPRNGYGDMPPLAVSALKEQITLPAGEYVFSARLTQGGVAYDGDLKFTVAEATDTCNAEIAVWGVADHALAFLHAHGGSAINLNNIDMKSPPKMVLVGNPDSIDGIDALHTLAQNGCNVVFADADFFVKYENVLKRIAGENAYVRYVQGSIYHHDHINISHPVFDGIKDAGVLEFDKFGVTYPTSIFHSVNKPTRTVCASIRIDSSFTASGLTYGEYAIGKGKYIVNTFRIHENIGLHPYADMLLINTVKHYTR
ncbi:MAG: hypothetical protein IJX80_00585 [Clostridia bacterium]|nr:hypothetical protein [Clostridia bacterium]